MGEHRGRARLWWVLVAACFPVPSGCDDGSSGPAEAGADADVAADDAGAEAGDGGEPDAVGDGAADDAATCLPGADEFCNGRDDDCDGAVDEGVWCWVNPLPTGNPLLDAWGAASDDVWVVGAAGEIVRYDGSTWTRVPSGTPEHLEGVWGAAPDDVWAVGRSGTIRHWDGRSWGRALSGTELGLWGVC